jgi:hypothetical protein
MENKYHKCALTGCETTMSEGSPKYCPEHNNLNKSDKVLIDRDYLEHLLACLANQKFINSINADALSDDTDIDVIRLQSQRIIDQAWCKGMDLLITLPTQNGNK